MSGFAQYLVGNAVVVGTAVVVGGAGTVEHGRVSSLSGQTHR